MGDEKSEMSDEVAARAESGWVGGGKGRTMHTENQEGLDYRACQRPRASGRAARQPVGPCGRRWMCTGVGWRTDWEKASVVRAICCVLGYM